ncbi:unnamed protein product [Rotaria sp. Silwood2]|nr:unnamed protein product [Rotaria sp. Silwood2]CAF4075808.1 unnamed protein product [Rotaria sp. Silwood2]
MDDFDIFNQASEGAQLSGSQHTNIPDDDLFGSENTSNTINTTPVDTFNNNPSTDTFDNNPPVDTFNNNPPVDIFNSNPPVDTFNNNPPVDAPSNNPSEDSWVLDDNFNSTAASESTVFSENTLTNLDTTSQITSFDDDMFTNQSNTNELDIIPNNELPPPSTNDVLRNDTTALQSEERSSYDMFSKPLPSSTPIDRNLFTTGISSQENLSALEAFNNRRQQEIAEKDMEEKQKIEAIRQQAKQDIERWYQERKLHMERNRLTIQNAEDDLRTKSLEKSDKNTCDWAKVMRFLEFTPGTQLSKGKRDLTRMKTSILNAKRDNAKSISTNGV